MAFLIISLLVLFLFSARFRLLSLYLIAAAVIGGYVLYLNGEKQQKLAKSRIPAEEVAISGVHIDLQNSTYHFIGRITNNSKSFTLKYIELHLIARDCATKNDHQFCVAIGDAREPIQIIVPPGQSRDLNEPMYTLTGNLTPRGKINWQYNILETTAD